MYRIDKRNSVKAHYFSGICGLISFIPIVIFLVGALFFNDFFSGYVNNEHEFRKDFDDPIAFLPVFIGIPIIFFPYLYILYKAEKIFYDDETNQIHIKNLKLSCDEAIFSSEYIYWGLCFCFLSRRGSGEKYVFISSPGINKFVFGARDFKSPVVEGEEWNKKVSRVRGFFTRLEEVFGCPIIAKERSIFHNIRGSDNIKFLSKDDYFEFVYDRDSGALDRSAINGGAYSYCSPYDYPICHVGYDVVPYFLWGNGPEDATTSVERLKRLFGD